MPTLLVHPEAIAEARYSYEWYRERNERVAAAFEDEYSRAIEAVLENPDTWPTFDEGTRRFIFSRFPYFLIYRHVGDTIHVIALMHERQEPGYWKIRGGA